MTSCVDQRPKEDHSITNYVYEYEDLQTVGGHGRCQSGSRNNTIGKKPDGRKCGHEGDIANAMIPSVRSTGRVK